MFSDPTIVSSRFFPSRSACQNEFKLELVCRVRPVGDMLAFPCPVTCLLANLKSD
jgi:hypothetical protein